MKIGFCSTLFGRLSRWLMLPVFLAAALGSAPLSTAHAIGAIITVDTLNGGLVDGDGDCSLAEAIENANSDGLGTQRPDCAAGAGDDDIVFSLSGTILLTQSLPTMDDPDGETTVIDGDVGGDGDADIVIDGDHSFAIFTIDGTASFRYLTIQNATDSCCSGGAVFVTAGGDLAVERVLFYGNAALGTGGAIANDGVLSINRSSFVSNTGSTGGAIHNGNSVSATVTNSTFMFNSATTAGGAIFTQSTMTLLNNTFSQNSATSGEGAALHVLAGTTTARNNILANSTAGDDCENNGTLFATYNLVEDATPACGMSGGVNNNIVGFDPMLGPPSGVPAYFPLKYGSPAVDAGDSDYATGSFDEPGNPRISDIPWAADTGFDAGSGVVDMGAYEAEVLCFGGARYYVDDTATGANYGTSWADAFPDLQMALYSIEECGSPTEVWVAAGLYKPDGGLPDGVTATFNIPPGADVYGGFDGTESALSEQDWLNNVTVLSGDIDDSDTTDLNGVVLQVSDQHGLNARHVVTMDGTGSSTITASTILDGFTITGGAANGSNWNGVAGGLFCNGEGSGNACSPTLTDLHFRGNVSNNGGGAVILNGSDDGNSSPSLTNVSFYYNESGNGGALAMYGYGGTSSPFIFDAHFAYNHTGGSGGAVMLEAGNFGETSPSLERVVFDTNTANQDGGALFCGGTGGSCSPTLYDVTFQHNSAGNAGGAAYHRGASGSSNPTYNRGTFFNNSATNAGGAVYNDGSSTGLSSGSFNNVTFRDNNADDGGAMYNNGDGGTSSPNVFHATFAGNEAIINGGAMYNSAQSGGASSPFITNTILWDDVAGTAGTEEIQNAGGTPNISYSVVEGGCASITGAVCGAANLATDPVLGSMAANGGLTNTMALGLNSSAIDTADFANCITHDQRSFARPRGAECDMGAYERIPPFTDFELDYQTDPAKFVPGTGYAWWLKSSTGLWDAKHMGGDVSSYVARSDFDGDGKTDPAKYVSGSQALWWFRSSDSSWDGEYMGTGTYSLMPGSDFDGDGETDPAKYVTDGSYWHLPSSTGVWVGEFIGTDATPALPGSDYDGDGKTDLAKYVAAGAIWYQRSSDSAWDGAYIGSDGTPVPASDFDGDSITDMAKYLTGSNTLWYVASSTSSWVGVYLGPGTFTYVAASDFDGDGKTDPAKFDTGSQVLWWLKSSTGLWDGSYMGPETYEVVN